jgi:endogenous inhibitor of DNA gyrase (YacG/DUF329 family)
MKSKEPAKPAAGTKCARCNRNATRFTVNTKTPVCSSHYGKS